MGTYVILENIRSAHNVGSTFRTSDAAGVKKIFLIGTTPAPIDRFGREQKEIAKVALGAEKTVAWEWFETVAEAVEQLKKGDVEIVAVEQAPNAQAYREHEVTKDVAYIFGNEVEGISEPALQAADATIEIPMKGEKESLNVAVSVGVILFA